MAESAAGFHRKALPPSTLIRSLVPLYLGKVATFVAETPQPAELARVLAGPHTSVDAAGARLVIRGTTTAAVSELSLIHISEPTRPY